MAKSFLECVHDRKQERLIQGILYYLLNKEEEFKKAFCEWLGEGEFEQAEEEYAEGQHRHDLVLWYDSEKKKTIELKFHSGFTTQQQSDPHAIDLCIVPAYRRVEAQSIFHDKVKTWEDFVEQVVSKSKLSGFLLENLNCFQLQYYEKDFDFYWILNNIFRDFEQYFFEDFRSRIENEKGLANLTIGKVDFSKKRKFHYGYYIRNPKTDRYDKKSLWLGIIANIFSFEQGQREYDLILQVCSLANALSLKPLETLPAYYPFEYHNEGIILKKSSDGKFHADDVFEQCKHLLERYAGLARE